MKPIHYLLTALLLLSGCSKDEAKEQEETQDNRPELFGYKFGSTIEEVDPDEIITPDSCVTYNWDGDLGDPAKIFLFKDNKLVSICDWYDATGDFFGPIEKSVSRSINALSPPVEVELIFVSASGLEKDYWKFPDAQDGLSWQHNDLTITIYNAIAYRYRDVHSVIIKYTRNDGGYI